MICLALCVVRSSAAAKLQLKSQTSSDLPAIAAAIAAAMQLMAGHIQTCCRQDSHHMCQNSPAQSSKNKNEFPLKISAHWVQTGMATQCAQQAPLAP